MDFLFLLIKSLTRSEKRYFKIYAKRHVLGKENNYILLFDTLVKMDEYDEERLLTSLKDHRMTNRIEVAKTYLYKLIIKAMRSYRSGKTIEVQLLEKLETIDFLFEKKLYPQAYAQLKKAKKMATDFEKLSLFPELLHWEERLMAAEFFSKNKLKDLQALKEKQQKVLNDLLTINEFWQLDATLYFKYHREGIAQDQKGWKVLEQLLTHPILKMPETELPFQAKRLKLKTYSTWYFLKRDFEKCYPVVNDLVMLLEEKPAMLKKEPLEYIQSLNNLLNMTQVLGKSDESKFLLAKLEKLLTKDTYKKMEQVQLRLFESFYYHQMNLHRQQKTYKEGLRYLKNIEKGMQKFSGKMNPVGQLMICFHVFQLCYGATQWNDALDWLDRILQKKNTPIHQEIILISQLVLPIVTFNLYGNNLDTQRAIRQTYKFLSKRKPTYELEKTALSFIKKLPKITSKQVFKAELQILLHKLESSSSEERLFAYFDFKEWIQSETSM